MARNWTRFQLLSSARTGSTKCKLRYRPNPSGGQTFRTRSYRPSSDYRRPLIRPEFGLHLNSNFDPNVCEMFPMIFICRWESSIGAFSQIWKFLSFRRIFHQFPANIMKSALDACFRKFAHEEFSAAQKSPATRANPCKTLKISGSAYFENARSKFHEIALLTRNFYSICSCPGFQFATAVFPPRAPVRVAGNSQLPAIRVFMNHAPYPRDKLQLRG